MHWSYVSFALTHQYPGLISRLAERLCPRIQSPTNGVVSTNGYAPGSSARYYCGLGYRLVGRPLRRCLSSGEWTNEAPACVGQWNVWFSTKKRKCRHILWNCLSHIVSYKMAREWIHWPLGNVLSILQTHFTNLYLGHFPWNWSYIGECHRSPWMRSQHWFS